MRRRLEDEDRVSAWILTQSTNKKSFFSVVTLQRRSTLEANLHSMEVELESVRVQLEEEAEARLDLERQLSKANQDCLSWKSKYDHECTTHTEEIEELRYVKL